MAIGNKIQDVKQPIELGNVFEAVAHLLPLHDQIASEARARLRMKGLF